MVFSKVGPNQSIEWGQIRVSKSILPSARYSSARTIIAMPVNSVEHTPHCRLAHLRHRASLRVAEARKIITSHRSRNAPCLQSP